MVYIVRLNFMLLFCVHSSKFGKCLLTDLRIFNIFIIITRILHVIIKHAVLFMDVFQPFKVAKSKFF